MRHVKKGVASIFLFLLSLSVVNAEIVVNGPDQSSVNIGDEITISGYAISGNDVLGLLKFNLICPSQSSLMLVKSISLKAGLKKDFSDEFAILSQNQGNCNIQVILEEQGSVLESKSSSNFEVTSLLTGTFKIDKETIQAGEKVTVIGNSFKQNGEPVEGFVIVTLKKNGEVYFADTSDVKNGEINFPINTMDIPGGEYNVEVEVRNNFGNSLITTVGKFSIISVIEVNAHSDKGHYLPKEKVKVGGSANVLGGKLKKGNVFLSIGENSYEEKLKNGNFEVDFYLLNTIESGKHDIELKVEDEYGNFGIHVFSIVIDPIPTKISIVPNREAINPGDSFETKAFLYDQASNIIDESLNVKVVNERGDIFYDNVQRSGEQFTITMPNDVVPGNYYIKGSYGDVEGEKFFIIGQVVLVNFVIEGQELVVTNDGNVPYDGILNIKLEGTDKTSTVSKDVDLGIGQEERINLGRGMLTGVYKVTVNDKVFENVQIEGASKIDYRWVAYVVALLILVLFWIYLNKTKGKRIERKIHKAIKHHKVIHPNRKHGEFGGASLSRVKDDIDHVKKYKDYMKRAVDFDSTKKVLGMNKKQKKSTIFSFGKKEKPTENLFVDNVFSGVKSSWSRDDTVKPIKEDKDNDKKPPENLFGIFD